jgi:hypothetical protein
VVPPADPGSEEALRRQIEAEREALAASIGGLRGELSHARPAHVLDRRLALALGLAAAFGFVIAGGLGASLRLAATHHPPERAGGWLRIGG